MRIDGRERLDDAPAGARPFALAALGAFALSWSLAHPTLAQTSSPEEPDPDASLYAAIPLMQRLHGWASIDTLHMRVGEQQQLRGFGSLDDDERIDGAWARAMGWTGEHDSDRQSGADSGAEIDWDLYALQGGVELYRNRDPADDEAVDDNAAEHHHAGITFAIARAEGEVEQLGAAVGTDAVDAYSLGGYWTKFGDRGGYLDAVVQATWYDLSVQSARLPELSDGGFGAAASVEIGKPYFLENDAEAPARGWIIEPQGQLLYQVFDEQSGDDAAASVSFQDTESLLGRLGLRLANTWIGGPAAKPRLSTIWGRINAWHELGDPPKVVFSSGRAPFIADIGERWLELNAGVTAQVSGSGAIYADAGYLWDTGERGDALHGRIGARWSW